MDLYIKPYFLNLRSQDALVTIFLCMLSHLLSDQAMRQAAHPSPLP